MKCIVRIKVMHDKKFEYWLKDSHHINEKKLFTQQLLADIKFLNKSN